MELRCQPKKKTDSQCSDVGPKAHLLNIQPHQSGKRWVREENGRDSLVYFLASQLITTTRQRSGLGRRRRIGEFSKRGRKEPKVFH